MVRRLTVIVLAGLLVLPACGDDSGKDDAPTTEDALATIADVIVAGYEDLDAALVNVVVTIQLLCDDPSVTALDEARSQWQAATIAYRTTRAGGIGPATDRRLNSSLGFLARPEQIDELLAGTEPVDVDALAEAGGGVKGLSALETVLFADGSDELVTSAGARRCAYATSVAAIARDAARQVLTDWKDGYRDELVDSMDPQDSLGMLVNEVSHRLTELDDQGLRTMTEAASLDELPDNAQDGPAGFRMAELRALLAGVQRIIGTQEAEGRLLALVAASSPETADRLVEALDDATAALEALPESVTESFGTPALVTAQAAAADLDVLVSTEVASQLGVTIGFSDADGDS
jgi:uncharacterized protein